MNYAEIKEYYERRYHADAEASFAYDEQRTRAHLAPLLTRLAPGTAILDVGCGVGFACAYLSDRGYRVTGIDLSEHALALARERVPAGEFRAASEDGSLSFPGNSFDGIACLGVLEHILEPARVLAECARVLRPGGVASFVVPNSRSPYFLASRGTGQVFEVPRTRTEWEELFHAAGLEPIGVERDPGPRVSIGQSLGRTLKLVVHRVLNRLPIALTYQFVFELRNR